jgi:phosphatidylglycerophosphatase A
MKAMYSIISLGKNRIFKYCKVIFFNEGQTIMSNFFHIQWLSLLATMFGIGKVPKGSGTLASLVTLPIAWGLSKSGPLIYMAIVVLLAPIGIWASEAYEKKSGTHDSSEIVIDEFVGMLITMTWLPWTWQSILLGFALFRILDIFKPFPIGFLDQKMPGGAGVMADDIAAGMIANLILQIIYVKTAWLGMQYVGL